MKKWGICLNRYGLHRTRYTDCWWR